MRGTAIRREPRGQRRDRDGNTTSRSGQSTTANTTPAASVAATATAAASAADLHPPLLAAAIAAAHANSKDSVSDRALNASTTTIVAAVHASQGSGTPPGIGSGRPSIW